MRTLTLLSLLAVSGCGWNLPDNNSFYTDALWDARDVAPVGDGVYVRLDAGGQLVRVRPDGASVVDLGVGSVERMAPTPDGQKLVSFVRYYRCEAPDPREVRGIDRAEDCPGAYLDVRSEIAVVEDGDDGSVVATRIPIDAHYNAITFSEDSRWAIAWLDPSRGLDLEQTGVVDLTSVLVLDLAGSGEEAATPVSVGFGADRVLFTQDASRAIVLSKDAVASVDLTGDRPDRGTYYPLTLDADQAITPVGVQLTQDGQYALITAAGQDDLYALRLSRPAINLVSLSAAPSAMALVPDLNDDTVIDDKTVVVHGGAPYADVVDHDTFDVETFQLDEGMSRIAQAGRRSVLWSDLGRKDVYVLDHDSDELVEFRLENPAVDLQVTPGGAFAVALTRPEGGFSEDLQGLYDRSPVLEILEIGTDRGRTTSAKLLDGLGVGMAFDQTETRLDVLVLQQDQDYLYQLDLYTDRAQEIDITAPPLAIGTLPDGGFWITHDAGLGLVSFYDPSTGELAEVGGFAAAGWRDGTPLEDTDDEEGE